MSSGCVHWFSRPLPFLVVVLLAKGTSAGDLLGEDYDGGGVNVLGGGASPDLAPGLPLPYWCDFDTDFCGLHSPTTLEWKRWKGRKGFFNPIYGDHTTGKGYYACTNLHYLIPHNASAELVLPRLRHKGTVCLQFAYIAPSPASVPLTVLLSNKDATKKELVRLNKSSLSSWQTFLYTMEVKGTFQVTFHSTKPVGYKYVALDDIYVYPCEKTTVAPRTTLPSTTPSSTIPPSTTPSSTTSASTTSAVSVSDPVTVTKQTTASSTTHPPGTPTSQNKQFPASDISDKIHSALHSTVRSQLTSLSSSTTRTSTTSTDTTAQIRRQEKSGDEMDAANDVNLKEDAGSSAKTARAPETTPRSSDVKKTSSPPGVDSTPTDSGRTRELQFTMKTTSTGEKRTSRLAELTENSTTLSNTDEGRLETGDSPQGDTPSSSYVPAVPHPTEVTISSSKTSAAPQGAKAKASTPRKKGDLTGSKKNWKKGNGFISSLRKSDLSSFQTTTVQTTTHSITTDSRRSSGNVNAAPYAPDANQITKPRGADSENPATENDFNSDSLPAKISDGNATSTSENISGSQTPTERPNDSTYYLSTKESERITVNESTQPTTSGPDSNQLRTMETQHSDSKSEGMDTRPRQESTRTAHNTQSREYKDSLSGRTITTVTPDHAIGLNITEGPASAHESVSDWHVGSTQHSDDLSSSHGDSEDTTDLHPVSRHISLGEESLDKATSIGVSAETPIDFSTEHAHRDNDTSRGTTVMNGQEHQQSTRAESQMTSSGDADESSSVSAGSNAPNAEMVHSSPQISTTTPLHVLELSNATVTNTNPTNVVSTTDDVNLASIQRQTEVFQAESTVHSGSKSTNSHTSTFGTSPLLTSNGSHTPGSSHGSSSPSSTNNVRSIQHRTSATTSSTPFGTEPGSSLEDSNDISSLTRMSTVEPASIQQTSEKQTTENYAQPKPKDSRETQTEGRSQVTTTMAKQKLDNSHNTKDLDYSTSTAKSEPQSVSGVDLGEGDEVTPVTNQKKSSTSKALSKSEAFTLSSASSSTTETSWSENLPASSDPDVQPELTSSETTHAADIEVKSTTISRSEQASHRLEAFLRTATSSIDTERGTNTSQSTSSSRTTEDVFDIEIKSTEQSPSLSRGDLSTASESDKTETVLITETPHGDGVSELNSPTHPTKQSTATTFSQRVHDEEDNIINIPDEQKQALKKGDLPTTVDALRKSRSTEGSMGSDRLSTHTVSASTGTVTDATAAAVKGMSHSATDEPGDLPMKSTDSGFSTSLPGKETSSPSGLGSAPVDYDFTPVEPSFPPTEHQSRSDHYVTTPGHHDTSPDDHLSTPEDLTSTLDNLGSTRGELFTHSDYNLSSDDRTSAGAEVSDEIQTTSSVSNKENVPISSVSSLQKNPHMGSSVTLGDIISPTFDPATVFFTRSRKGQDEAIISTTSAADGENDSLQSHRRETSTSDKIGDSDHTTSTEAPTTMSLSENHINSASKPAQVVTRSPNDHDGEQSERSSRPDGTFPGTTSGNAAPGSSISRTTLNNTLNEAVDSKIDKTQSGNIKDEFVDHDNNVIDGSKVNDPRIELGKKKGPLGNHAEGGMPGQGSQGSEVKTSNSQDPSETSDPSASTKFTPGDTNSVLESSSTPSSLQQEETRQTTLNAPEERAASQTSTPSTESTPPSSRTFPEHSSHGKMYRPSTPSSAHFTDRTTENEIMHSASPTDLPVNHEMDTASPLQPSSSPQFSTFKDVKADHTTDVSPSEDFEYSEHTEANGEKVPIDGHTLSSEILHRSTPVPEETPQHTEATKLTREMAVVNSTAVSGGSEISHRTATVTPDVVAVTDFYSEELPHVLELPFWCDFDVDTCDMTSPSKLKWKRWKGRKGFHNPIYGDHTSGRGFYAVTDLHFYIPTKVSGSLVLPSLRYTGTVCLHFAYIAPHPNSPTVTVLLSNEGTRTKVATIALSDVMKWQTFDAEMNVTGTFQIIFHTFRTAGYKYIGLDDVSVRACGVTPSTSADSTEFIHVGDLTSASSSTFSHKLEYAVTSSSELSDVTAADDFNTKPWFDVTEAAFRQVPNELPLIETDTSQKMEYLESGSTAPLNTLETEATSMISNMTNEEDIQDEIDESTSSFASLRINATSNSTTEYSPMSSSALDVSGSVAASEIVTDLHASASTQEKDDEREHGQSEIAAKSSPPTPSEATTFSSLHEESRGPPTRLPSRSPKPTTKAPYETSRRSPLRRPMGASGRFQGPRQNRPAGMTSRDRERGAGAVSRGRQMSRPSMMLPTPAPAAAGTGKKNSVLLLLLQGQDYVHLSLNQNQDEPQLEINLHQYDEEEIGNDPEGEAKNGGSFKDDGGDASQRRESEKSHHNRRRDDTAHGSRRSDRGSRNRPRNEGRIEKARRKDAFDSFNSRREVDDGGYATRTRDKTENDVDYDYREDKYDYLNFPRRDYIDSDKSPADDYPHQDIDKEGIRPHRDPNARRRFPREASNAFQDRAYATPREAQRGREESSAQSGREGHGGHPKDVSRYDDDVRREGEAQSGRDASGDERSQGEERKDREPNARPSKGANGHDRDHDEKLWPTEHERRQDQHDSNGPERGDSPFTETPPLDAHPGESPTAANVHSAHSPLAVDSAQDNQVEEEEGRGPFRSMDKLQKLILHPHGSKREGFIYHSDSDRILSVV